MVIRGLHPVDLDRLRQIHEKFYKKEFPFPDFYKNFLCCFTVVENEEIICSGGVRAILESVIITDKDKSVRARHDALLEMLTAISHVSRTCGFDQLCATVIEDEKWKKHLLDAEFTPIKGEMLVLNL